MISILAQVSVACVTESRAGEKFDLKLRLKPGQKFGVRLTTELYLEDESFKFERGMDFEVKEVDAHSIAKIRVIYRALKLDVTRQVMSAGSCRVDVGAPRPVRFQYDSTKQFGEHDYSKVLHIEAAGVGESFIIKVTPKGEIIELDGVEQMQTHIAEKVIAWDEKWFKEKGYEYKEGRREVRRHNTKSHYSEDGIRSMLGNMIVSFPGRSLGIGDSWTDKVKIWGKNYEIDGTYILKSAEKRTVTISLSAKRTPPEKAFSWVNNEGRKVGFKIVGSCQGSFEIDQQTGWLLRSKLKARFTGQVIDEEADNQMTKPILEEEVITVEPME